VIAIEEEKERRVALRGNEENKKKKERLKRENRLDNKKRRERREKKRHKWENILQRNITMAKRGNGGKTKNKKNIVEMTNYSASGPITDLLLSTIRV